MIEVKNKRNHVGYMIKISSLMLLAGLVIACTNNNQNKKVAAGQSTGIVSDTLLHELSQIKEIIDLSRVVVDTHKTISCGIYKVVTGNESVPGPSDYYLISTFRLLSFNNKNYKKINTLESPLEKKRIYYKNWLPEDISVQLFDSLKEKQLPVYSADVFAKSPYLEGFFIILGDSTIYLNMQTK